MLEADLDKLFAVGRFLRAFCHDPGARKRRVGCVFEFAALMADVPEIAVA